MTIDYDSGWVGAGESDDLDRALIAEAENEPFDLNAPHIMTALGPIAPAALGITLGSGGVLSRPEPSSTVVDAATLSIAELELFHAAGGRTVVVTAIPVDDGAMDRTWEIAARSPCHLVLTAGVSSPWSGTVDELALALKGQVTIGTGRRHVRAGILGIAISANPEHVEVAGIVQATVETHRQTGVPILLRGRPVAVGDWLQRLITAGIEPDSVVVALESGEAAEADRRFLEAGTMVLVERDPSDASDASDRLLASAIMRRVADGFVDRLLLADRSGHGWNDLLERLPLALMDAGCDAPAVRRLLVDNPARVLTIGKDKP